MVDDNKDAADTVAFMLELSGWDATAVYSGQDALDAVAWSIPDVVLLDIGMPGMSGFSVAARLHNLYGSRCPVLIALTAWSDERTKICCGEVGMAQHLAKPVEMDVLLRILGQLVQLKEVEK